MEKAVCNHGFFMMAPNVWNPKSKSLTRPLTLSDSSSVSVTISHPETLAFLVIQVHGMDNVSRDDEELILKQVGRMLRISAEDERDVTEFQQLHEDAKKNGFGRIFRSPSLFEDMVKSILLCNTTWERTLGMASNLCMLQSKLADRTVRPSSQTKKRKRVLKETKKSSKKETRGNFPSAKELASLDKKLINEHCKLGYRANWIVQLAKKVESGELNLEEMERGAMKAEQVSEKLIKLSGFGAFATATVLMCIVAWKGGMFERDARDSSTVILRQILSIPVFSLLLSELSPLDYKSVSGCSHMKELKAD
ncbi:unnamed protein product [Eruca vesicaria subsp. sativa]|uniref:PGG domain-containing protein n=1 Tax=Eruca vesicaria subsp. sativa TaxID=29727 RepID=A0ABC8KR99_ERUVS|nr:unnamed protein product [Eruca vesicaria subsp. sativa]